MSNWIFVESYHNWSEDYKNNFKYMGILENKFKLKNISIDDKIFTYISKIKKFSDVRKVIDVDLFETPDEYSYDKVFKKSLKTKLVKLLDKEKWVNFSSISKELEVFALSTSPANKLLNAPIKLENHDFMILSKKFQL